MTTLVDDALFHCLALSPHTHIHIDTHTLPNVQATYGEKSGNGMMRREIIVLRTLIARVWSLLYFGRVGKGEIAVH